MISIEYINDVLMFNSQEFSISELNIESNAVFVHLVNENNDFTMVLVENETTINDVIQTSAQMIYDTLTSNV